MVVKRSQAQRGQFGEKLHVRGPKMEMRYWKDIPAGFSFAPHDSPLEEFSAVEVISR